MFRTDFDTRVNKRRKKYLFQKSGVFFFALTEDVAREPDVTIFDNTRGHLAYLKDGKLNGSCFTLRGKGSFIRITLVKVTYINRVVFFLPKPRNGK